MAKSRVILVLRFLGEGVCHDKFAGEGAFVYVFTI